MAETAPGIRLYMDVNVHGAVTAALRDRGHDVVTAQEDGMRRASDDRLLDRAMELGRVLVTHDTDFLAEAARRQQGSIPFAGVVYAHPFNITVTTMIDQLEMVIVAADPTYMQNRVEWLPM